MEWNGLDLLICVLCVLGVFPHLFLVDDAQIGSNHVSFELTCVWWSVEWSRSPVAFIGMDMEWNEAQRSVM
jgi:hypothetical protein